MTLDSAFKDVVKKLETYKAKLGHREYKDLLMLVRENAETSLLALGDVEEEDDTYDDNSD